MWKTWGRKEMHTRFWWGKPGGKRPFEDLGVDGRLILKLILNKQDERACIGLIWLGIRTSGWLL
jgi:hypothetical protein